MATPRAWRFSGDEIVAQVYIDLHIGEWAFFIQVVIIVMVVTHFFTREKDRNDSTYARRNIGLSLFFGILGEKELETSAFSERFSRVGFFVNLVDE